MHCIGELRTEQLDVAPVQLRVRVTRRPRYACRACEGAIVVAEAPARPIDGGMPTEALIVHVVVSKFCDSLPLYRQSQMLARQGITLDRSTLSNWVGSACWWLSAALRSGRCHGAVLAEGVRRRHQPAGARSRARADQEGLSVGVCGRRSSLVWTDPSGRGLHLCRGSQEHAPRRASRPVHRRAAGGRL